MARSRQVGELIRPTIRGTQIVDDPVGTEVAPTSVSTFEHVGIYWVPDNEGPSVDASVEFRVLGSGAWLPGYPLWYDARVPEYRGIIRGLAENTTYELKLTLSTGPFNVSEFTTWNDDPHISSTVTIACGTDAVPRTTGWNTSAAGSATGGPGGVETYVKYVPLDPAENVLDIPTVNWIGVNHSYVILDGFKIKNPAVIGFLLANTVNHVRIQNVEVSGWGRENLSNPLLKEIGRNFDSAVHANQSTPINQVVVQRFRFHSPRWPANSNNGETRGAVTVSIASPAVATQTSHGRSAGDAIAFRTGGTLPTGITAFTPYYVIATGLTSSAFQFSLTPGGAAVNTSGTQSGTHALIGEGTTHPEGAQGIVLSSSSAATGNNVIRDGSIYSENGNFFNDGIGGSPNFSLAGCPGSNSAICRVLVTDCMDDGIESEGGNACTLVEGNYVSRSFTGYASGGVAKGPLWFHRNIFDRCRTDPSVSTDATNLAPFLPTVTNRGPFGKLGDAGDGTGGRRVFTHNTLLQHPPVAPGVTLNLGTGTGPSSSAGPMTQTVGRNNIWQVLSAGGECIRDTGAGSATNNFDYELCNGVITSGAATVIGTNLIDEVLSPVFDTANGHGNEAGATGLYQLHASSRGYGEAEPIPNFNSGVGSDVGAAQHGDPPMTFGCPW